MRGLAGAEEAPAFSVYSRGILDFSGLFRYNGGRREGFPSIFKEDPKGVEIMCRAFEETRNEKAIRIAMNMIEDGSLPLEKIAELCELPLEKVQELAEAKSA
ncbi:MAG: hypothetical protein K6E30_09380 [Lachnospiraceae bacterium]|nr:hypothetical protein [Lachnospiraceae bacterium]